MSMISVVMAMGIGVTVMMMMSQAMVNQMNGSAHVRLKNDKESIRSMIEGQISCSNTMPVARCTPNAKVNMVNKGNEYVQGKIGSFSIRATCNAAGNGFVVETARFSIDGTKFLKDPLTKKEASWARLSPVEMCGPRAERDMECYEATRQNNTLGGAGAKIVQFTGTTKDHWGLTCKAPYVRTGCSIVSLPTIGTDRDIAQSANGCTSDNEEWDERAIMHISCCKINK